MLISTSIVIVLAIIAFLPFAIVAHVMPKAYEPEEVRGTQRARFDDGTIRYQDAGDGDTAVLFLHGFNGQLSQWNAVWEQLEGCDCRRVRVDVPGFGGSDDWDTENFGLQAQAERIIALMDRLQIRKVTLVGTSMGGSLSAWIAARYADRVDRLALVAPSGFPGSLTLPGLYGKMTRPGTLNGAAKWIAHTPIYSTLFPGSRARQALTVTADYGARWEAALAQIRAPTLILWSTQDDTTAFSTAERVQEAIAGSALIRLDAATGHLIPEARPELLAHSVELLIKGTPPADVAAALPDAVWRPGDQAPAG
ncbi:MAG TPA: alpha/beta hydrolase [Baekduia sp.]|nr:alpha/beta hydrolase [Baekduia sp.]